MTSQKNLETSQKNTEASLRNPKTQVGQLAKQLAELNTTHFSANTQTNPKGQCMAITTRSGKEIGKGIGDNLEVEEEVVNEKNEGEKKESGSEKLSEEGVENNVYSSVNKENKKNKKIECEKKEKSEEEVLQLPQLPYPLNPSKFDKERQQERQFK